MIMLDKKKKLIEFNASWEEAFGDLEISSQSSLIDICKEFKDLEILMNEALLDKTIKERDLLINGRHYNFKMSIWTQPDEEVGGITVVANNIDDLMKKRAEVEESNQRYRLVVQGASVGIWDWMDMKSGKEYWSPRFYELLGYADQEISASLEAFQKLLHPDDTEATTTSLNKHFAGEGTFDVDYRLRCKNGEYRWFQGRGQAAFDSEGKPLRMVGSIQDIHEKVLAEKELKRSNEDLDQFAYIASHDLREPLRGMRNCSQFLLEDYADKLDDEGVQYLDSIKKLGTRLEKYLDALLYFSRLGREEMTYRQIDLNFFLNEVQETYLNFLEKNIEVKFVKKLPTLFCDPLKMMKVFGNLLQNSVRYNLNEKKVVSIDYEHLGGDLYKFLISDNGIGIKESHWEKIFIIFKRLHTREKYEGGTGLGLTLVKKAVERHGGEVWVERSELGKGTTFAFTIKERQN